MAIRIDPPITYSLTKQDIAQLQLEALDWLTGRCEDQMVRGWITNQRDFLKKLGEPIDKEGRIYESR